MQSASMRAIWAMAIKDLRLLARDRAALFLTFAWPLILASFFGALGPFGGEDRSASMRVLIVDEDRSSASAGLREQVDGDPRIELAEVELDPGLVAIQRGEAPALVRIPAGYGAAPARPGVDPPTIELTVDPRRTSEASMLVGVIERAGWQSMAEHRDWQPLTIVRRDLAPPTELGASLARARPPSPFAVTFPQGIVWAVIACAATFAVSLVGERTRGTLLRLLVAPLSPIQILAGKALACLLAIAGMQVVLVAIARLGFGVIPQRWDLLALALASTAIGFVGIMTLLAALGRRTHSAAGLAWMVLMLLAMLGGGMLPLFLMPSWLQMAAGASPVAWSLVAIEGAVWRGFGLAELALPCAALLGLGLVSLTIGSRVVREP
ncbi:ABC transporter permease [Nannocystaceae bacterium ST9]